MATKSGSEPSLSQRASILLAVVMGVAVVGYVIGIRAPTPPEIRHRVGVTTDPETPRSVPYFQLVTRRRALAAAAQGLQAKAGKPAIGELPVPTAEQRAAAIAARGLRRAFDGAPPTIPHVADEQDVGSCLACHQQGLEIAGKRAPVMSHAQRVNCTQCHVTAVPRGPATFRVENTFAGLESSGRGARAWTGAPPVMSHGAWMRDACGSCHGRGGLLGLHTPHPGRPNCQQCHVPDSAAFPF